MNEVETIFRSVTLTIVNSSQYAMDLQDSSLTDPAVWAPNQTPQPDQEIQSGQQAIWLAQTAVTGTGVKGHIKFAIPQGGVMRMNWNLPWVKPFTYSLKRIQWFDPDLRAEVVVDSGNPANVNLQLTLFVQYVVQIGDTLETIAQRFHIGRQQLEAVVPGPLKPGMRIIIPLASNEE